MSKKILSSCCYFHTTFGHSVWKHSPWFLMFKKNAWVRQYKIITNKMRVL